jgi:hypothetical protein
MLLVAMVLLGVMQDADRPKTDRVDAVLAEYHALTSTSVHCVKPKDDTEISVCANRKADNYRVPLVLSSSPQNSVPVRTAALLDPHRTPCGEGAFTSQCGYVGVSVSTNGSSVHYVRRERAP